MTEDLYKMAKFVILKEKLPASEDLIQELVTEGHRRMSKFDPTKSTFSTFIYMVMKRYYLCKVQVAKYKKYIPEELYFSIEKYNSEHEEDRQLEFFDEERNRLKDAFFKDIKDLMSEELKLNLQGFKNVEIAEKVNKSPARVGQIIERDIKRIKEKLIKDKTYNYYQENVFL